MSKNQISPELANLLNEQGVIQKNLFPTYIGGKPTSHNFDLNRGNHDLQGEMVRSVVEELENLDFDRLVVPHKETGPNAFLSYFSSIAHELDSDPRVTIARPWDEDDQMMRGENIGEGESVMVISDMPSPDAGVEEDIFDLVEEQDAEPYGVLFGYTIDGEVVSNLGEEYGLSFGDSIVDRETLEHLGLVWPEQEDLSEGNWPKEFVQYLDASPEDLEYNPDMMYERFRQMADEAIEEADVELNEDVFQEAVNSTFAGALFLTDGKIYSTEGSPNDYD
jgi:hypothetical protein